MYMIKGFSSVRKEGKDGRDGRRGSWKLTGSDGAEGFSVFE
jgi:hypothetical protein